MCVCVCVCVCVWLRKYDKTLKATSGLFSGKMRENSEKKIDSESGNWQLGTCGVYIYWLVEEYMV